MLDDQESRPENKVQMINHQNLHHLMFKDQCYGYKDDVFEQFNSNSIKSKYNTYFIVCGLSQIQ